VIPPKPPRLKSSHGHDTRGKENEIDLRASSPPPVPLTTSRRMSAKQSMRAKIKKLNALCKSRVFIKDRVEARSAARISDLYYGGRTVGRRKPPPKPLPIKRKAKKTIGKRKGGAPPTVEDEQAAVVLAKLRAKVAPGV